MITITGVAERINGKTEEKFLVLVVADTSKAAMKCSANGNWYVDCPTANLPWYRTKEQGELLKGQTLPGSLEMLPCKEWIDKQGNTHSTCWTYKA